MNPHLCIGEASVAQSNPFRKSFLIQSPLWYLQHFMATFA